jgi:hypothetical protein
MSADTPFTRDNLDDYLKALAKELRRLNGIKMQAEMILIGGAAILAKYGFRELTYDVDAVIVASSAMKEAINIIGDRLNLPRGWLNADFKQTGSYSDKLFAASAYYKTYSNILHVRVVTAEYLVAMKLMSGRRYKNDISDVYGILWEHQKNGAPISKEKVEQAIITLYEGKANLPESSITVLEKAYGDGDFKCMYEQSRVDEKEAKNILLEFEENYPHTLKSENIESVIEQMKRKRDAAPKDNA